MTVKELIIELLEYNSDIEVKFTISHLPNNIEYRSDNAFFDYDYNRKTLDIIIDPFQSYQDGPLSTDSDRHKTTNNSFGNYLNENISKKSSKFKSLMMDSLCDDKIKDEENAH
jgi:hypothetical protein